MTCLRTRDRVKGGRGSFIGLFFKGDLGRELCDKVSGVEEEEEEEEEGMVSFASTTVIRG